MAENGMKQFLKDRKEAFTNAVMKEDWDGLRKYCKKYGVKMPDDEEVMKVGTYIAVQQCADIDLAVKLKAAWMCIKMGYGPDIN